MASVTKIVGTGAVLARAGSGQSWVESRIDRLTANDGSPADTGDVQNLAYTNYAHGTMSGNVFAIAADQQIDGVEVKIDWSANGTSDGQNDVESVILTSSLGDGDNKSDGYTLTTTQVLRTYGSPTDTWGLALTPAVVNGTDFGVKAATEDTLDGNAKRAQIDYIEITVYHSDAVTFKPKPRIY